MRLSLVIPAYNCRDAIVATVDSALRHLASRYGEAELIVVDDGSTDGTADELERFASGHRALRVIRCAENRGKGAAVRIGMLAAAGDCVVFTDVDFAYPLSEIDKILAALDDGADLAIATRVDRDSRFLMSPEFFHYLYTRHLASRLFNRLVNAWFRLAVSDTQAGLKGFRRAAGREIFSRSTIAGFTFDVEVLFVARGLRLGIREVPVLYRYSSEPTTVDFLRDGVNALRALWQIRQNGRRGIYR